MSAEFGHTPAVAISDNQRDDYLQFACSAVRAAGRVILPHFRSGVQVTNKVDNGGFDPVTLADQAGERAIREAIELAYPEHGIFGEEYGFNVGNGAEVKNIRKTVAGNRQRARAASRANHSL